MANHVQQYTRFLLALLASSWLDYEFDEMIIIFSICMMLLPPQLFTLDIYYQEYIVQIIYRLLTYGITWRPQNNNASLRVYEEGFWSAKMDWHFLTMFLKKILTTSSMPNGDQASSLSDAIWFSQLRLLRVIEAGQVLNPSVLAFYKFLLSFFASEPSVGEKMTCFIENSIDGTRKKSWLSLLI